MNLLQIYCTLLMADMAESRKAEDPEGWDSLQAMIGELKAVASGEPAGDLAMRALAGIFPQAGPAVAMEAAREAVVEASKDASARGENAGTEASRTESAFSETTALAEGQPGTQSAILTALAQLATGIRPQDGSTAQESLDKAFAAASPVLNVASELLDAAAEAASAGPGTAQGLAADPAMASASAEAAGMEGLSTEAARNAEQAATELTGAAGRIRAAGSLLLRMAGRDGQGSPGKPGVPGTPGETSMPGDPGIYGESGADGLGAIAAETAETEALATGLTKSAWQQWQARVEEKERAVTAGTAGIPKDEEFRVPGQLSPETMADIAQGKETLDLVDSTPLGSASGVAAAGAPSMVGERALSSEIGNMIISGATDKENVKAIATEVTTNILRKEVRAVRDNFDDGVWA